MPQLNHRADLSMTGMPLLTQDMGRTVLVSAFKNAPTGERNNQPQIYYAHNVMPTKTGLVSVGYETIIPTVVGVNANVTFDDVRIIFSETSNRVHLGITTDGHAYTLEGGDTIWRHSVSHPALGSAFTTLGKVNGVTYIYLQGVGCFTYNDVTHTFTSVTLTGLSLGTILGITGSSGYLVVYDREDVAWSSTIDPTDFVPSAVTGAGGGSVSDREGNILFVVPNSLGLVVYTAANAVAATYTGNKAYPFKFKSIDNSKGSLGLDQVAYEANSAAHFAYTKGGLQTVDVRKTSNILPEVTDFLAGKQLEDFDEATKVFTTTDLTTTMKKKVKLIASRYLIISYGITEFTHALVYDITLESIGKLKVTHTDVFEYLGAQTEISKESIAFLTNDGAVKILKFSVPYATRTGVLLLGKFQYERDRHLVMQSVTCDNVALADSFECYDLVAVDGITNVSVTPMGTSPIIDRTRTFRMLSSGKNHSLLFIGKFNLTTVQILFSLGGRR